LQNGIHHRDRGALLAAPSAARKAPASRRRLVDPRPATPKGCGSSKMRRRNLRRDCRTEKTRSIPPPEKPQVDDKNPNPALKEAADDRPAAFSGMHATGPGKCRVRSTMPTTAPLRKQHLGDRPDTLRVEGCVGALCGGETWTRVGR